MMYDGTGKCDFLTTWNIKCNNTPWSEDEDQEDDFEDCNQVAKWVMEMEIGWGTGLFASIANYIEIVRDYHHPWYEYAYDEEYGEYEESFEADEKEEEDGLNRDNQVEKENGEAEIDFGNNVVNVPTEEQIHHDLA